MSDEVKGPNEQIIERDVESLIRSIQKPQIKEAPPFVRQDQALDSNSGNYVFLIGAGSSNPEPAGIPTAGELIETWRSESFNDEHTATEEIIIKTINQGLSDVKNILEENELDNLAPREAFEEASDEVRREIYILGKEEEMKEFQNEYGFWFEQRYGNQAARRNFIRELVENRDPPFGTVVLGLLMERNYVPITLTPNFDDLLFDAFYLFLDGKPQVINYDAIASQFKVTAGRPTIVKLHGDHLNYNLRNTGPETFELSDNIEEALSRTLREYGLVVVGYGGEDESIMGVLEELPVPTQGIYWCARDREELSERAKELLKQPNTFYIEIEGSDELFTEMLHKMEGLSLPIPDDIEELGEKRADTYDSIVKRQQEEVEGEEREIFNEYDVISKASDLRDQELYDEAIEELNQLIEYGHRSHRIFSIRGNIKDDNGDYEGAIEDYNQALEINEAPHILTSRGIAKIRLGKPDEAIIDFERIQDLNEDSDETNLNNLAEAKIINGDYEGAIESASKSYEIASKSGNSTASAESLLLLLISKIILENDVTERLEKFQQLCEEEFTTTWSFQELDSWIDESELDDEKHNKIEDLINQLRSHKDGE